MSHGSIVQLFNFLTRSTSPTSVLSFSASCPLHAPIVQLSIMSDILHINVQAFNSHGSTFELTNQFDTCKHYVQLFRVASHVSIRSLFNTSPALLFDCETDCLLNCLIFRVSNMLSLSSLVCEFVCYKMFGCCACQLPPRRRFSTFRMFGRCALQHSNFKHVLSSWTSMS